MKRSIWVWRLRSSPLRRRSYATEAWAYLAVALIAVTGAVLAGATMARHMDDRSAQQRLERHSTQAMLTQDATEFPDTNSSSTKVAAPARWTAPDGTVRTGDVKVAIGSSRGTRVTVWTDARGSIVAEPLPATTAHVQADATGGAIAVAICGGALLGCGITSKLLDRRRTAQWATEWAEVGPRWDRRTA
jgi:hypothetical protein